MMKYERLVNDILKNIGGKDNIISLTHCITRLRFKLKDEKIANTDVLKSTDGVITVMQSGGQYQVVIGNHVPDVYTEFLQVAGIAGETTASDAGDGPKGNILDQFIDILSGVFQPILGILCATGMIKGLLALLTTFNVISPTGGTYMLLYAVADCLFNFFPIFLGFTAAKKFGLSQFVGMAIGGALVYPTIGGVGSMEVISVMFQGTVIESSIHIKFMGIPVIVPMGSYASTVIPVILSVAAAAPLERWLRKTIPDVVKNFLVPFFTLLIIVPLSFIIIGPIATLVGNGLGAVILALYGVSPTIAGVVIGGVWQILVIFGLHWGLIPIAINNMATFGNDPVVVMSTAASFAQIGAVLAVMLKTKDKNLKSLSIPAFISGIFGVTEPAIYGITLPRKKTFIASCIGAAVGGGLIGFMGIKSYIMGGLGVFGYPSFINPNGPENHMFAVIIITIIGFAIGFALSYILFNEEPVVATVTGPDSGSGTATASSGTFVKDKSVIYSPLKGEVIPLDQVKDEAFASGAIGQGVAIIPSEGKLYAPVDGVVSVLFETKHAFGIVCDDGAELMIHIGMDTVQLKGKYFTPHIKQGDRVKKGQLLEDIDLEGIKKAGYSTVTPVIVTNYFDYLDIVGTEKTTAVAGDELIYVIHKKNDE